MSAIHKYEPQPVLARESLFRQKLNQLRSTGEIQRLEVVSNQSRFREIEQSHYLHNIHDTFVQQNPVQIEKLALLDSLTDIYNHNNICRMLKDEVKRARRYQKYLSVIILTIDYLSQIAEQGGPLAFDAIMKGVSQFLLRTIRDVDIPGRYSRDQFMIILPETNLAGGITLSKRLCNNIQHEHIADIGRHWQLSLSTGIATYPELAENEEQLLELSLQSLTATQQSKNKNC